MRKLKLRVWNDYWKKYATEAELYIDGSVDAIFETEDGIPHHENADLIIEQYTGLKDKNAKEIYEGDIVNIFGIVCKVYWNHDGCCYQACNDDGYISTIWIVSKYGEVIGNIHENYELLRKEEK